MASRRSPVRARLGPPPEGLPAEAFFLLSSSRTTNASSFRPISPREIKRSLVRHQLPRAHAVSHYPDGLGPRTSQLVPEAAVGFPKVSNNGKTYDFTVNAGFTRVSDGSKGTAANFKAAFDRIADPKMQSPASAFMSDVVGASASPVSGVKAKGNHLIVTLVKPSP